MVATVSDLQVAIVWHQSRLKYMLHSQLDHLYKEVQLQVLIPVQLGQISPILDNFLTLLLHDHRLLNPL